MVEEKGSGIHLCTCSTIVRAEAVWSDCFSLWSSCKHSSLQGRACIVNFCQFYQSMWCHLSITQPPALYQATVGMLTMDSSAVCCSQSTQQGTSPSLVILSSDCALLPLIGEAYTQRWVVIVVLPLAAGSRIFKLLLLFLGIFQYNLVYGKIRKDYICLWNDASSEKIWKDVKLPPQADTCTEIPYNNKINKYSKPWGRGVISRFTIL